MARLGPFEAAPRLAVGVSGGADSLALTVLADRWARRHGGTVLALTVDHGLRAAAGAEAAQVGAWLAARGIAHRILAWAGPKPRQGLQAAARAARRGILLGHCSSEGILHLLLAHHEDDQAETLVMRVAADSGLDGLAGMAGVVETRHVRVLRPLLAVPRARLAATLLDLAQPWIEDPSNRDPRFSRARLRALAAGGRDVAAPALRFGGERALRECAVAELLARTTALYREGWACVAAEALSAAAPSIARRALARILMCVGGDAYPPRSAALDDMFAAIGRGGLAGGRTLAGCRLIPRGPRLVHGGLLVVREAAAIGAAVPVGGPGWYEWDGRFQLRVEGRVAPGTVLRALGDDGWRAVAAELGSAAKLLRSLVLPPVRATLPALCDLDGVVAVPHLTYRRQGVDPDSVKVVSVNFRPRHALAGAGFASVADRRH
ncbi:MAG TPA: tRNA lysidine(34) synthetase TilS [Alphaproteobacteria bacterium]|nr:tRNA lysidine(34) synthetase TilS [Alphaproteobacteria bacterium]